MKLFEKRVLWLGLLNIWDLIGTYYFVIMKAAVRELNPAMNFLIHLGPKYFIVYKLLTMFAIVALADFSIKNKVGELSYKVILSFYMMVGLIHALNFLS